MLKKIDKDTWMYILRLTLTLLIICAVVAGLLAAVNAITKDRIAAAKEEKTLAAIAKVLPDSTDARQVAFTDDSGIVAEVYEATGAYAVRVCPMGCKGTIEMMVGVDLEGNVLGVSIISHSEDIGNFISADSTKGQTFRQQFVGYDGTLDAVSGATITSRAVETGVLAAVKCVKEGL